MREGEDCLWVVEVGKFHHILTIQKFNRNYFKIYQCIFYTGSRLRRILNYFSQDFLPNFHSTGNAQPGTGPAPANSSWGVKNKLQEGEFDIDWSTLMGRGPALLRSHWSRASLVLLASNKYRWLPCTERSYYRRPYAIKNQFQSS